MKRIVNSKIWQGIATVCQIYLGLALLGIVRGWSNAATPFSVVIGVLLLVTTGMTIAGLFRKNGN